MADNKNENFDKDNQESFINADDMQTSSLIHYNASEEDEVGYEEISDYINQNAQNLAGNILGVTPDNSVPQDQISMFDDTEKSAKEFDSEAFLKQAKMSAAGFEKIASTSSYSANTIGGYGMGGASYAQRPYASPMLTLSDMKMPKTTTEFFKWCKYYYVFDPLISGAINACSTFPVTDIYLEDSVNNQVNTNGENQTDSDELKLYKRVLIKNIGLVDLCINIGIDYNLYGNCIIFGEFKTGPDGKPEWSNVIRLDPNRIIIDFNPVTQEKRYKWQVPESVQKICREKKPREAYDKIPDIIKQAVEKKQTILLNSDHIYHFARPTDSGGDNAVWGVPLIAHVLKLITYRNILRQAQEAIAREHIVPMRIYYIQQGVNGYNPNADWNNVADNLAGLIARSVRDPNFKVVSPVPVGLVNVGGEGKQLLLTPEIDQIQSEILAGMNVPREFIFGGVSYSGTSISLRILENQFITYRLKLLDFINDFLIRGMAKERGDWTSELDDDSLISAKMVEMKMVDDVQQKQLIIDLNRTGKVTDDYMWKAMGLDPDKIRSGLEQEAYEQIKKNERIQMMQIDSQIAIEKYQREQRIAAGLDQPMPDPNMQMQGQMPDQGMQMQQPQVPQQEMQGQAPQDIQGVPQDMQGAPQDIQAEQQAAPAPEEFPAEAQANPDIQNPQEIVSEPVAGAMNEKLYATARALLRLPEAQREAILSSYPVVTQRKIQEVIATLSQDSGVDMRPMPEQKPPRRAGY